MKKIGLIGGIGWASTLEYYRVLNQMVVAAKGQGYSADLVVISFNQREFIGSVQKGPQEAANMIIAAANQLASCGAEYFAICANGAHRFVDLVTPYCPLPMINIIDETVKEVSKRGVLKVGLLGVKETMTGTFYPQRLAALGVQCLVPNEKQQDEIHSIIYDELIDGNLNNTSKIKIISIMNLLAAQGAEGFILGCTELPLLLTQEDFSLPLFDTLQIHCESIIRHSLY